MATCPVCNAKLVGPSGDENSPILLVGEFPGFYEMERDHLWAGPAGKVLDFELGLVGISLWKCRSTNLWLHEKSKECDVNWHIDQLAKEVKGKRGILFMGSDVSRTLFGMDISKSNSLPVSGWKIEEGTVAVLAFNPAMVNQENAVLGEFRLAVTKFKEMLGDV